MDMTKLNIKNIQLDFPTGICEPFTDAQFVEWFEYEFGLVNSIAINNPLLGASIKDCKIKIDSAELNGNKIKL